MLALEPSPEHAIALRRACDLARAELTLVHSKDEFLDALDDSLPDLILLPSLLPPADESQLFTYLRTLTDSSHVQVLLTPHFFASETNPPVVPSRSWRRLLTRQPSPPKGHACDLHSFAERVAWALQSAEEARQTLAARYQWLYETPGISAEDRRVHRRIPAAELPWLQVARIKDGPQVRLVDLSEGGVLLETDTRMRRGSSGLLELIGETRETVCSFRVLRWQRSPSDQATMYRGACAFTETLDLDRLLHPDPAEPTLALQGPTTEGGLAPFICYPEPDTSLAVSARFVRSEVATVGPRGVKYHAAATFEKELQLWDQIGAHSVAYAPKAVAELLADVLREFGPGNDPDALRSKFSERLRKLVPAREIQIINCPSGPREGSESIYFSVPASGWPSAVLQATFEPDYEISEVEFRLLQTAATLASVLLDLERRS